MSNLEVKYQTTGGLPVAPVYKYGSAHCADLFLNDPVKIYPGEVVIANTGLRTEIPEGYGARILERSSTVVKHRVTVKAGTIDSDYRNTWGIVLYKLPGLSFWNAIKIAWKNSEDNNQEDKGIIGNAINIIKEAISLYWDSHSPSIFQRGSRVAQVKFEKTVKATFINTTNLNQTERNLGGFGSSGK